MKVSLAIIPSSTVLVSGSRLAACAATWCAVHCAITPFLAVAAPALALSEGAERVLWAGTVVLGAVMLLMGPARRSAAPVLTFVGGAAIWGGSLAGWFEPVPETVTSAAGGLTLAGALVWSARICQAGACPACDDEETTDQSLPPSGARQQGRRRFFGSP
ncbi:MAG: MerC family mercury resistance protein [Acidobacteriota bacterium]|nr:MerC family mercury resistance protein [Acidobacteriota bacterium]MDE2711523.1 MerC family mercury resistance protein [Acidobacteriota bacterium]MXX87236.1 MerC domain-containing protein [Acidobacteriota bacterium]MYE45124.1 MerC domain-containing protein [Acidobacteriota bacterium]MYG74705.1 MerC domain-containing protein [Acidobacteriota bacterium]